MSDCGSPYLLEKTLKDGLYLVCPNSKKTAEAAEPKRRGKKKKEEEPVAVVVKCDFSKRIGDAPPREAVA